MLVSDILARLSRGPLSNLAIGMDGAGTIQTDKIPTVIDYLNQALLHLHSRFILNEKQVIVAQDDLISLYKLNSANSVRTVPTGYIQDADPQPAFTNDVLKILGIYDDVGLEFPLNDEGTHNSLFTPRFDTIQVPEPKTGNTMFVLYQAGPVAIDPLGGASALAQDIDIPVILQEALVDWCGYKVFSSMNGQEHLVKAKDLFFQYEAVCKEIEDKDMLSMSVSKTSTKFSDRGFV
jgi:hypothetical protein